MWRARRDSSLTFLGEIVAALPQNEFPAGLMLQPVCDPPKTLLNRSGLSGVRHVSSACAHSCSDGRKAESPTSESLVQQSEHLVFLVLFLATRVAAPIAHFVSSEVGNIIDAL